MGAAAAATTTTSLPLSYAPEKMMSLATVMEDAAIINIVSPGVTKISSPCPTSTTRMMVQYAAADNNSNKTGSFSSRPAVYDSVAAVGGSSNSTPMETLDLMEWCNHRVLARQADYYATGIIRAAEIANSIVVAFDHPEGSRQTYYDVFGGGRFDVISDASPSASDVSMVLNENLN